MAAICAMAFAGQRSHRNAGKQSKNKSCESPFPQKFRIFLTTLRTEAALILFHQCFILLRMAFGGEQGQGSLGMFCRHLKSRAAHGEGIGEIDMGHLVINDKRPDALCCQSHARHFGLPKQVIRANRDEFFVHLRPLAKSVISPQAFPAHLDTFFNSFVPHHKSPAIACGRLFVARLLICSLTRYYL